MNTEEMLNNLERAINMIKYHYICDKTQTEILDNLEAVYEELACAEKDEKNMRIESHRELTEKDQEIIKAVMMLQKHFPKKFKIVKIVIDTPYSKIYYGPATRDGGWSDWLVWEN